MSGPLRSRRGRAFSSFALLLFVALLLLPGCTAELAIIATPVSAQLFQREELDAARAAGLGRVIVVAPGDPAKPGIMRPGIGGETRLLIFPEVAPEEIAAIEAGGRLFFRVARREGGERDLILDRRPAFRALGELLTERAADLLEESGEAADTITVRLFALQGSGSRVEEMQALLEPLRRSLPPEAILVEEVATGFTVAAIEERLREAREGDPILLFLGSAGAELFPQVVGGGRIVATEALFVPPEAEPLEGPEAGDLLLLGLDPLTLFEAALAGEGGAIEASLYRLRDPFGDEVPR